jgi:hypothetical protein
MTRTLRQFRDFFVSLRLTVVLLVLGLVLVFAATIDQVHLGIWAVQEKWFRSFFVLWRAGDIPIPVFPGGYLIGGLLLINLIAAHIYRFKKTWRKIGIEMTHAGLILLLLGELLTGLWQEEYMMQVAHGESKNYSESQRDSELVIIDTTNPGFDEVVAIPEHLLASHKTVQHPKLPFRVVTKDYYPNSTLRGPAQEAAAPGPNAATKGIGAQVTARPLPLTYKQNERNVPSAYVELIGPEGSLGTWMVSVHLSGNPEVPPQRLEYAGHTYTIAMRFAREYKPFSLTLLKFSFDRYAGTDIPKNFSSRVRLTTPDGRDDREVLIYMNNPLRYGGYTFYQADYDHEKEQYTVLQVVRNPSWLIPYIACGLMTFGLIVQFGIHLVAFIRRRRIASEPKLA